MHATSNEDPDEDAAANKCAIKLGSRQGLPDYERKRRCQSPRVARGLCDKRDGLLWQVRRLRNQQREGPMFSDDMSGRRVGRVGGEAAQTVVARKVALQGGSCFKAAARGDGVAPIGQQ